MMRRVVEARPGLRWRAGQVATGLVYRRAFGSVGAGTVIVRPHKLQGVDRIHNGAG